ncbi:Alpha/beta hydrolase family protein [Saccharopolyspora antimicrobica]|uniref:Alpha/beta hydrolase family protein n=1 Tax=Saccharopolyspora antimicrobica TaxID=455193 RepID=A0A1I5L388_9PSEU|nr:alpha/beta hydrolase [Saccharopolyspora antimicrobica]RKT86910.1 alpha/beta hydrolase family protein [Saccharopolyspora antimicrobica]SFO91715.1 Alpha/beta hydrolase family protein [Saccharopolyspora antimicrobica]
MPLRRWITRSLAVLAAAIACAVLLYTCPLAATPTAREEMRSDAAVTVVDRATEIELIPSGQHRGTGLVFYPGARVDSRAYLPLLRPVAEAGYPVVVLKPPLGMAILHSGQGEQAFGRAQRWVAGGHSLGGPAAARLANSRPDQVRGLLLWASYPDVEVRDLDVTSIYGTRDGLSDPAAVRQAPLPADTEFVAVPGAVHAHFGDYGPQSGDGQPTTSRADAQRQIVAATLDGLARVEAQP